MDEQTLFTRAIEIADPEGRTAWLDQACGANASLRQRVEALLKSHTGAGSFLAQPLVEIEPPAEFAEQVTQDRPAADSSADAKTVPLGAEENCSLDFLDTPRDSAHLGRLAHYEVLEVVGRGGMGIVFKALDETLHRVVAVKVMAPQLAASASARKRFTREAQAAAAVSHDHVVTIHAVAESDHLPYLVMQFVSGVSLQERLDATGSLAVQEILRIGMQTAQGLAAAHAQGLVHRDIKPANILLENGVERVKITDFGLARVVDDASLTQSGVVAGTPQYMSPEQAQSQAVDARADLFSLGCVLYAMCTGRSPFRAETTIDAIRRVCDDTPRPIRELNSDIPEWLIEIIDRLLAKRPDERYQTAAEVADLLGSHLARVQDPGSKAQPESQKRIIGRKSWRPWLTASASLLVAMGGLALTESMGLTNLLRKSESAISSDQLAGNNSGRTSNAPALPNQRSSAAQEPFAILAKGVDAERPFATLADAIRGASDGDTIEIHGNGPFSVEPIEINNRTLTIRAGEGFRPTLQPDAQMASPLLSSTNSTLTLEGVELQFLTRTDSPPEPIPSILRANGGELRVANCRFVRKIDSLGSCVGCNMTTRAEFRNTEFVRLDANGGGRGIGYVRPSTGDLLVDNCVDLGRNSFLAVVLDPTQAGSVSVDVSHTTSVADFAISVFATRIPERGQESDVHGAALVSFKGRENVFDSRQCLFQFSQADPTATALHPRALADLCRRCCEWRDYGSLFSTPLRIAVGKIGSQETGPQPIAVDQADWERFWNVKTGSLSGSPKFLGGEIYPVAKVAAKGPDTGGLRLSQESPGYRAGTDGKDLGANIDLVGPGAAYERWKKTPAYEEWLKETNQLKDRVAVNSERQASAILGGAGAPERKFDTPADAVPGATPSVVHESRQLVGHEAVVWSVAFSPDGNRALSGSGGRVKGKSWTLGSDFTVRLWDVQSTQPLSRFTGHQHHVQSVVFTPDGRHAVGAGKIWACRRWDIESGQELPGFSGVPRGPFFHLALSEDAGQLLSWGGKDKTLRLWDVAAGSELWMVEGLSEEVTAAAFSKDGRRVATAGGGTFSSQDGLKPGSDYSIRVWNAVSGKEELRLRGHNEFVRGLAFLPDGRRLLSGGADDVLRLWDLQTHEQLHVFQGHTRPVNAIALSQDGRWALSGSADGTVCLWDIESKKELRRYVGHTGEVRCVAISPDRRDALSGGEDETVRLWQLPEPKTVGE